MHQVEFYIEVIARLIDWLAIAILLYGVLKVLPPLVAAEFGGKRPQDSRMQLIDEKVRRPLGRYLLLGLELLIVSDIIHTTISRTLEDLLFLGGVVIIRTVVSYFLNREVIHLDSSSGKRSTLDEAKVTTKAVKPPKPKVKRGRPKGSRNRQAT